MSSRLQRLIEWPLWSWRHLVVSVAALLVVLSLVGKATNFLTPRPTPASVAATPLAPIPSPSLLVTPMTVPVPVSAPKATATGAGAPASSGAAKNNPCQEVATGFMNAWVRTGLTPAEWLGGMRPLARPEFMTQLSHTDPARVPASKVTSQPVAVVTASATTPSGSPQTGAASMFRPRGLVHRAW